MMFMPAPYLVVYKGNYSFYSRYRYASLASGSPHCFGVYKHLDVLFGNILVGRNSVSHSQ